MSSGLILLLASLVLILLFSSTVTLGLRRLSLNKLSEKLEETGRETLFEAYLKTQSELILCAATARSGCSLALVLAVHRATTLYNIDSTLAQYIISFACSLVVVTTFGVAIPGSWAKYAGESLVAALLPFLLLLRRAFFPAVYFLAGVDGMVRRLMGVPKEDESDEAARHERELLDAVTEGEKAGAFDEEEKEMIESIIDLRDSSVAEIMTPRTEIRAVPQDIELSELKDIVAEIGHSRIPVYDDTIDSVVGIVYAKDLLTVEETDGFDARKIMRTASFIPETKNLRDLLHEFQTQKVHMAIVLDEYGGTAGLVTIEDILEELVGEIVDEYDADEPEPFTLLNDDTAEVDARVRVEELNEELNVKLPEDEDYETIGGFVFSTLGRIPNTGDSFEHENLKIEILEAEPRKIKRLRIQVSRPTHNGGEKVSG